MIGPFVGKVHSQTAPTGSKEAALVEPHALQQRFTGFLARSQRLTRRLRVAVALVLVVPLAFLASRVEQPVAIGLCGVLVLVPVIWVSTALVVPVVLMGRERLAQGGGLTVQVGVPIAVDDRGLSAGEARFAWASVTSVLEDGDGLLVEGVDIDRRVVFQITLAAKNFASHEARTGALATLRALHAAAGPRQ